MFFFWKESRQKYVAVISELESIKGTIRDWNISLSAIIEKKPEAREYYTKTGVEKTGMVCIDNAEFVHKLNSIATHMNYNFYLVQNNNSKGIVSIQTDLKRLEGLVNAKLAAMKSSCEFKYIYLLSISKM